MEEKIENGTVFYLDFDADIPLTLYGGYKLNDGKYVMFNDNGFIKYCTVASNRHSEIDFDSDDVVISGEKVILHDKPTNIEKIALNMLHSAYSCNPFLSDYIKAIVKYLDESRYLDEFIKCPPKEFYSCENESPIEIYPEFRHEKFHEFMINGYSLPYVSDELNKANPYEVDSKMDSFVYDLSTAVATYRTLGRPESDCVPFSLESHIVRFHQNMVRMLDSRLEEMVMSKM